MKIKKVFKKHNQGLRRQLFLKVYLYQAPKTCQCPCVSLVLEVTQEARLRLLERARRSSTVQDSHIRVAGRSIREQYLPQLVEMICVFALQANQQDIDNDFL